MELLDIWNDCSSEEWRKLRETEQHGYELMDGALALHCFVQANFTGLEPDSFCEKYCKRYSEAPSPDELDSLTVDGISPDKNVKYLGLLREAQNWATSHVQEERRAISWWKFRTAFVHQMILTEKSKTLQDQIFEEIGDVFASGLQLSKKLTVELYAECVQAHLYYGETTRASAYEKKLVDISGIQPSLLGALGRRTKFQEKPVAQLLVNVGNDGQESTSDPGKTEASGLEKSDWLPKNVALNDDTLLDAVKMENSQNGVVEISSNLDEIQQLALWAHVCVRQRSSARDALLEEEVLPFLAKVLEKSTIWSVQFMALFTRSKWEKNASRKVERSLAQVELLVNLTKSGEASGDAPGHFKSAYALAAGVKPRWEIEKFMAQLLTQLGCNREALEVYQRLGSLPDMIECFKALGKLERAETLIRDELAVRKTPQLLSYLGDVTDNPENYSEAWELSGQRYGRAQKQLGLFYLRQSLLEPAAEAFSKATTTLPVADQPWYNLGYCGLQLERFDLAAKAYRRVVDIDPESADGWNNLAAAYMHAKDHEKAYFVIQEALKANFENWKIWDNFLTLAVETRHWAEAIRAVHRLMDLQKSSKIDAQLLLVVARNSDSDVTKELRELLARVTATSPSAGAWQAYAVGLARCPAFDPDAWDKYAKAVTRALAMASQAPDWSNDLASTNQLLDLAIDILREIKDILERAKENGQELSIKPVSSVRLTANSICSRVKKCHEHATLPEDLKTKVVQIAELVSTVFA